MTEEALKLLIEKAQKGDLRSFEQVVEQYHGKIYNIALGIMGSPHDAEDAAQIALIKIYNAIGSFKFRSKFSTWVYRITANACMDEVRKCNRRSTVSNEDVAESDLVTDYKTPESYALSQEAMADLRSAVGKLKEDHKRMIVLRDINGFSYDEIAKITNCSVGTVKSRISRARSTLKDILVSTGYFER